MFALFCTLFTALAGIATVEILDVGQGDSILIQSPEGKTVLIDGGTGKVDVVGYLQERNISEINLMVGTHAHADHIGGLDEVLEAIPVKIFLDNGMPHTTQTYKKVMTLVENKEIKYIEGKRDQSFNLGSEVVLDIIHPQDKRLTGTRSDLNSNSVIIRMTHGDNCFLFTGDAEEPSEHTVVQKGLEPCDVLKVPHHGSNHSSTMPFLNAVQPEYALISLGVDNKYGHPGEETMARLEKVGAKVYRTDTQGTIKVESDGQKLTITTSKKAAPTVQKTHVELTEDQDMMPDEIKSTPVSTQGKFDINTATQSQLESIPGIGPSKASAIIAYRNEHGPFSSIQETTKVSGVGEKTAEKIAAYAFVQ